MKSSKTLLKIIPKSRIQVYNDIRPEQVEQQEQKPESPRFLYNQRLRSIQEGALNIINYLNMSSFRKRFQAQRGSVDLYTFIRIMKRIINGHRHHDKTEGDQNHRRRKEKHRKRKLEQERQARLRAGKFVVGGKVDHGQHHDEEEGEEAEEEEAEDDNITAQLMELFREIDLDGDGYIDWEEFTKYILARATLIGEPELDDQQLVPYHILRKAPPQYKRSQPYERLLAFRSQVACVEHESSVVHLYDMKTNGAQTASLRGDVRAAVLAMAYVPHPKNLFVTSHADMRMRVWNLDEGRLDSRYKMRNEWPVPVNQQCLCYVPAHKVLFSGSVDGQVMSWDVSERELRSTYKSHTDMVLDVLSLGELNLLASASLDGTICIWDIYLHRQRQKLQGHHQKGVVSLAYSDEPRLLASGGYDHDVMVWSPFVNTLITRLPGHAAPIANVTAVQGKPELISGDMAGIVKIWDLRNFRCTQTFYADGESSPEAAETGIGLNERDGISGIAHVPISRTLTRMVISTKKLNFFEQEAIPAKSVTDDLPIACACFNEVTLTIITAAGRTVRVWDAILGSPKGIYRHATPSDITAMTLDHRCRKILVGDLEGNIEVLAHHSGAWMKRFEKPKNLASSSVVQIVHSGGNKQVVVGYADHSIVVFDESLIQHCPILRVFEPPQASAPGIVEEMGQLSALCFSPHCLISGRGPYVTSGSANAGDPLRLWNFQTAKCETSLAVQSPCEYAFLNLAFLGNAPLLATSCTDGHVRIWTLWPALGKRRTCIYTFPNTEPLDYVYPDGEEQYVYPLLQPPPSTGAVAANASKRQSISTLSVSGTTEGGGEEWPTKKKQDPTTREWKSQPRLDSPRRHQPIQILNMAYDASNQCLYTGDEGGRLRRWDFTAFSAKLEQKGLMISDGTSNTWRTTSLPMKAGVNADDHFKDILEEGLIGLVWSLEAHDDAITCMELVQDPHSILTGSADQTVKIWNPVGRFNGLLIQGAVSGQKSMTWDLQMDVRARERLESDHLQAVSQEVILQGMRKHHYRHKPRHQQRHQANASSSFHSSNNNVDDEGDRIGASSPKPVKEGVKAAYSNAEDLGAEGSVSSYNTFITSSDSISLDSHSMAPSSEARSIMSMASAKGYHKVLTYLTNTMDNHQSNVTNNNYLKYHLKLSQASLADAHRRLRLARLDMMVRAEDQKHQQEEMPRLHFRKGGKSKKKKQAQQQQWQQQQQAAGYRYDDDQQTESLSSPPSNGLKVVVPTVYEIELGGEEEDDRSVAVSLDDSSTYTIPSLHVNVCPSRRTSMTREVEDEILALHRSSITTTASSSLQREKHDQQQQQPLFPPVVSSARQPTSSKTEDSNSSKSQRREI